MMRIVFFQTLLFEGEQMTTPSTTMGQVKAYLRSNPDSSTSDTFEGLRRAGYNVTFNSVGNALNRLCKKSEVVHSLSKPFTYSIAPSTTLGEVLQFLRAHPASTVRDTMAGTGLSYASTADAVRRLRWRGSIVETGPRTFSVSTGLMTS
jgi:hypothetical protein